MCWDTFSPCSSACSQSCEDPPALASPVLGLKVCTITPDLSPGPFYISCQPIIPAQHGHWVTLTFHYLSSRRTQDDIQPYPYLNAWTRTRQIPDFGFCSDFRIFAIVHNELSWDGTQVYKHETFMFHTYLLPVAWKQFCVGILTDFHLVFHLVASCQCSKCLGF